MFETSDFIDSYYKWLKDNTSGEKIDSNTLEITSPFLDRHNDYIQIYVIKNDDGYTLSDDGYIIADLELSGMSFNTPKRAAELEILLNRFGVKKAPGGALSVRCQKSNFPGKKHSLLQAMLAVNDLFALSQANVASLFAEDVRRFLQENQVRFSPNISITGKSTFVHNYEFLVPASTNRPERFMKLANNLNKSMVESILFAWSDTLPGRGNDSSLITLVNDIEKTPPQNCLEALNEYSIKTILWSKKDELLIEAA
jgi:hypothetical protein